MTINLEQRFSPGDWVRVRSTREIWATLDDLGEVDGLSFMPEMLAFVGQRFRVARRAEAACATNKVMAIRRLQNFVHLESVRCDGSAHGGCQSNCLMFWHDSWLELSNEANQPLESNTHAPATQETCTQETAPLLPLLQQATRIPSVVSEEDLFSCQASQLWQATTPLPVWNLAQYVRQIRLNGITSLHVIGSVTKSLVRKVIARLHAKPARIASGQRTPEACLQLAIGELVQVRPLEEIEATLNSDGKNRGLWFDPQMAKFCGRLLRVTGRIERMIDEGSGQLIQLKSPSVTLESVACDGCWHRFCSREAVLFWREIWLQRVPASTQPYALREPHVRRTTVDSPGSAGALAEVRD